MQDNPTLNREHIDRIRSVAQLRSVRSGEVLYEPSCPDVPLFVVLDGTVSISRTGEDEKILAVREPGVLKKSSRHLQANMERRYPLK